MYMQFHISQNMKNLSSLVNVLVLEKSPGADPEFSNVCVGGGGGGQKVAKSFTAGVHVLSTRPHQNVVWYNHY